MKKLELNNNEAEVLKNAISTYMNLIDEDTINCEKKLVKLTELNDEFEEVLDDIIENAIQARTLNGIYKILLDDGDN